MISSQLHTMVVGFSLVSGSPSAATLKVCGDPNMAEVLMGKFVIPADSLFRGNGRLNDPLAAFNGDHWQIRLTTVTGVVIFTLPELEHFDKENILI
jgi:hypothetical protein